MTLQICWSWDIHKSGLWEIAPTDTQQLRSAIQTALDNQTVTKWAAVAEPIDQPSGPRIVCGKDPELSLLDLAGLLTFARSHVHSYDCWKLGWDVFDVTEPWRKPRETDCDAITAALSKACEVESVDKWIVVAEFRLHDGTTGMAILHSTDLRGTVISTV